MTNPTVVTAIVMAAAALIAAFTPIVSGRVRSRAQADGNVLRSWSALNTALDNEIKRLQAQLQRMQEDHDRQLAEMRAEHDRQVREIRGEYETQLADAQRRIGDLSGEVAALQRALRGGTT